MALATRLIVRLSVLLLAASAVSNSLHAQERETPPVPDGPAVLARSGNPFTYRYIPDRYTVPPGTPVSKLLPKPPRFKTMPGPVLSTNLADLPEVAFADPLPGNAPKGVEWEDHFKRNRELMLKQIAHIEYLNEKRRDGFMETLLARRSDLAGLPFVLGDGCRLSRERNDQFVRALHSVRNAIQFSDLREVGTDGVKDMWKSLCGDCAKELRTDEKNRLREDVIPAYIAALTQILATHPMDKRVGLAGYLNDLGHLDATRALAKLAIFSPEREVREAAIDGLKLRREKDYTDILMRGLRYPWPAITQHAAQAIVDLKRDDLLPQLADALAEPDPRLPSEQTGKGKKSLIVRELVKINHLRNCMLCHPAYGPEQVERFVQPDSLEFVPVGAIPVPGEFVEPYTAPKLELFVRADVTYLRQDFSLNLAVPNADLGPENQRFDFVVRTRVVSEKEAGIFRDKLAKRGPGAVTPYERAILYALRELTGLDTEPTAPAWRELLATRP